MQSVTSNAVAEALRSTLNELMLIRTTNYWVRYLPPSIMFEQRNVGGKNLKLEFGIYQYNNNWSVQISWGTLDAVIQQSTGRGRTSFTTYTQNSTPTRTAYDCKIYVVNITIPSGSPIIGINSTTFMLIRSFVIT